MKNHLRFIGIILFFSLLLNYSCKKEKPVPPSITTTAVTDVSYTTAVSGGSVTNEGSEPVTSKGICWSTFSNPTISNNFLSDNGVSGSFTINLTQLNPNTTYYVRAYATNGGGTSYGNQISFTTLLIEMPVVTTADINSITQTSALSGGNITDDKGGTVIERGICWSKSQNPTTADNKTSDGTGTGVFSSTLSELTGNTTYYVRAYAINSIGTAYGSQVSFKTNPIPPIVTTGTISGITTNSVVTSGNLISDGGSALTALGICWSTSENPSVSDNSSSYQIGTGPFQINLTGLTPNTKYYVRAIAINSVGISYGDQVSFTTYALMDVDNNGYHTVTIGTQTWLKENLMTTHYNDNTPIPNVTGDIEWSNLTTPGYSWYNNDDTNKATYGGLYNWYAANTGKLCPTGWHIPDNSEWTSLISYLGGSGVAGGKLKEAGTLHWLSPNTNATDEAGFSALPGGNRDLLGPFYNLGTYGYWWSSTSSEAFYKFLFNNDANVGGSSYNMKMGYSVRCVKD